MFSFYFFVAGSPPVVKEWKTEKSIVKDTLMQIWKSHYKNTLKQQYPEIFAFLILRTLKIFTREVCKFLKK